MTAPLARLMSVLLGVVAFSLALAIEPRSQRWQTGREGGVLPMLFGDGRRLFANHFFAKADAYFHRGVYPSIFDRPRNEEMHMVTAGQEDEADLDAHDGDEHGDEGGTAHDPEACEDPTHDHSSVAGAPRGDWVAWINERVRPSAHAHLAGGDEREMLPWLALAAEMDPSNVQNFTITAYWLRKALGRVDEAEHFLREGLRHNPGDPRLLFELGVVFLEDRKSPERAYNVFLLAWDRWRAVEGPKPEPDNLLAEGILARLALVDEQAGRTGQAIDWLEKLQPISPNPDAVAEHIRDLQGSQPVPEDR